MKSKIVGSRSLDLLRDFSTPMAMSLLLLGRCLIHSLTTPFWTDEIFTYYPVTDPSFGHMLAASRDTINTTPPLYFVLCWGWARIFGDSELALRMFSSLSVCGAFWVMWKVLRPKYGFFAASASLVAAFLGRPLLVQNGEARFYGLYLLACAMAIERYDRLSNKDQLTWKDYLLNFLAHAALVFTHTFGFFYSFCVLLISFLFRTNRKRLTRFFGSVLLAWAMFFLIWGKPTLLHLSAFRPYSWIRVPDFTQLIVALFWCRAVSILAVLSAGFLILWQMRFEKRTGISGSRARFQPNQNQRLPLLGGLMLLLTIFPVWLASHPGSSFFLDRYFLPSALAWGMILSYMMHRARLVFDLWAKPRWNFQMRQGHLRVLGFAGLLLLPILQVRMPLEQYIQASRDVCGLLLYYKGIQAPGAVIENLAQSKGVSKDVPIVCTYIHSYNPFFFYSSKPSRYFFLLDLEQALADKERAAENFIAFKLMSALKKHYPGQNILEWDAFFQMHKQFLLLDENRCRWVDYWLLSNPEFRCRLIYEDKSRGMCLLLIAGDANRQPQE